MEEPYILLFVFGHDLIHEVSKSHTMTHHSL